MNLFNGGLDMYYSKQVGVKYVEKSNIVFDLECKLCEQIEINYCILGVVRKCMEILCQVYFINVNVVDVFLEQFFIGSK